uniref:TNFR-Cys domain-containing protein n=1 Tax=Sander lucioperca TaxID=283035 RepID=A0A8D0CU33_SANLU
MFEFQPVFPNVLTSQILVMSVFRGHTLTCPTEYQIGNQCCQMCPAGSRVEKDCTEFKQTSCLPCTEGTFMTHSTHFMRFGLKLKTPCTATSDTVCEPLEGFYCLFFIEDGCMEAQKHSSCQPGQYISLKALSDTECSNCSDGTFSDGTLLTSCQPHTRKYSFRSDMDTPELFQQQHGSLHMFLSKCPPIIPDELLQRMLNVENKVQELCRHRGACDSSVYITVNSNNFYLQ